MAAVINVRDTFLQSETRTNPVTLPSGINVDYSNVSNGPPVDATANFFTEGTTDPTGGSDGNVYYNSTTGVSWMKVAGVWTKLGTVNASQITTGTLAAARIASGSITASKLSVSTLSAITANLGTVNAGSITGSADIDIAGTAIFNGTTPSGGVNYALVSNDSLGTPGGILGYAGSSGFGVRGQASGQGVSSIGVSGSNTTGDGIRGTATSGTGVRAIASTGTALAVEGKMTMTNTTLVSNLNADMLDGKHASSLCSKMVCNVGSANASGDGFTFSSTVAGTRTSGSGNGIVIESTSDARLKEDIKPEKLSLDFIKKLKPVSYRMKDDPGIIYHGLIAQDMEGLIDLQANDCLYRLNSQGYYGVDYAALISPVIKAIQELDKKIELLNKKLKEITNAQ